MHNDKNFSQPGLNVANPMVTVVIPTYNTSFEHLRECLASIIVQTFSRWEAIVIDDASTSEAARVAVERCGDARIRYIRAERNRGVAAARNIGIGNARAQFVLMVDSDDLLERSFIDVLWKTLNENPDCVVSFSDFNFFGKIHGPLKFTSYHSTQEPRAWNLRDMIALYLGPHRRLDSEKSFWGVSVKECEPALLLRFLLPPGPGTLFRKSFLQQVGGYCEDAMLKKGLEDWDFWLTAAECNARVVHVPVSLYHYRQHGRSLTSTLSPSESALMQFVYHRHRRFIDSLRLRNAFLAQGYRRTAKAMWYRGEYFRAFRFAAYALSLDPLQIVRAIWPKCKLGSAERVKTGGVGV